MKICFASNNQNKLFEIQKLLGNNYQVVSLKEIGCNEDLPEPHFTLEENSKEKALYVFTKYNIPCFADDTGLEVEALKGEPGVFSARYAGEGKNSKDNIALLLKNLEGILNRKARFRTIITLVQGADDIRQFEGIVEGNITEKEIGDSGFGYDPIFIPEGYNKTFAEMNIEEKNTMSHRARALNKLFVFFKLAQNRNN